MADNFEVYKGKLDEFVNKGSTEWDAFLEWWKLKNEEPVETKILKRKVQFNIKFWLALTSGIGALALSGFRVSERFFSVAGGVAANPIFSYGEAIAAVFAVNVTIFALAVAYAYTSKKMNEYSQILGLGTAVIISSVAGLGQAAKALGPEWSAWVSMFDLVLAMVLGIGATALEYFSGDLLGVEIVRFYSDLDVANTEYDKDVKEERSRIVHEHREWLKNAKGQFGVFMGNFGKFNVSTPRLDSDNITTPTVHEQTSNHKSNIVNKSDILTILKNYFECSQTLPGVSDLTRELAMKMYGFDVNNLTLEQKTKVSRFVQSKKGNVSQVRKAFMNENNIKD